MRKVILIITSAVIVSGCSLLRRSAGLPVKERKISNAELIEATLDNNISGRNFYISKASVVARTEGNLTRFIASIKYRRPDSLLLSIRATIGTEVARVFMTADTIMINDRINRDLIVGKPGARTLKYGISPDIFFMILGDLVLNGQSKSEIPECMEGNANYAGRINGKSIMYFIDCKRQKITKTRVEEDIYTGSVDLKFSKFGNFSGAVVPGRIDLTEPESRTEIRIEIEKMDSEWNGNIEFKPGTNYNVRHLR